MTQKGFAPIIILIPLVVVGIAVIYIIGQVFFIPDDVIKKPEEVAKKLSSTMASPQPTTYSYSYPTPPPIITDSVTKWNIFRSGTFHADRQYEFMFPQDWAVDFTNGIDSAIRKGNSSISFLTNAGMGGPFTGKFTKERYNFGGVQVDRYLFFDRHNKIEEIKIEETKGVKIQVLIDTSAENYPNNLLTIDQILSTFKFIDQNQLVTTNLFEDDRIRLTIPTGWEQKILTTHVSGDKKYDKPVGVTLTKDHYVFTLATHWSQASGIRGGRFEEITQFLGPWFPPYGNYPCPTTNKSQSVNEKLTMHHVYVDTSASDPQIKQSCGNPKARGVVWYGAYMSDNGGYFIGDEPDKQMVFTLRYDTNSVDALPQMTDPKLQQTILEAIQIIKSIIYP